MKKYLLFVGLLFVSIASVFGQYQGGIGRADIMFEAKMDMNYFFKNGYWKNISNWTEKRIPLFNELALIRANAVVDTSIVCGSLRIESGSVTINPGIRTKDSVGFLKVNGDITNLLGYSGIIVRSAKGGANGSLIFSNPSLSPVPATVRMYSKAVYPQWQFIACPVQTTTWTNLKLSNTRLSEQWMYLYHENDIPTHWEQMSESISLKSDLAYAFSSFTGHEDSIIFTGNLFNQSRTMILPYSTTAAYAGCHLIPNPYTASINLKSVSCNNMTKTFYLYNTGSYDEWSSFISSSGNAPGQYLTIPQTAAGIYPLPETLSSLETAAVLIKHSDPSPSTISFDYNMVGANKTNGNEIQRSKKIEYTYSVIYAKSNHFSDFVMMLTVPGCTHAFDNGWDGEKMLMPGLTPQLVAMEHEVPYQVDSFDDINNSELAFQAGVDTVYTLLFNHYNFEMTYRNLYLYDMVEKKYVNVTEDGTEYTFTATNTDNLMVRFKLFTELNWVVTGEDNVQSQLNLFNSDKTLYVDNKGSEKGQVMIYDMSGRLVETAFFMPDNITTVKLNVPAGVYTAKALTKSQVKTRSIIVK